MIMTVIPILFIIEYLTVLKTDFLLTVSSYYSLNFCIALIIYDKYFIVIQLIFIRELKISRYVFLETYFKINILTIPNSTGLYFFSEHTNY